MSMSTRSPAPASPGTTTGWARGAGQAIAASMPGRSPRLAWLFGAAVASSLVAACGTAAPGQPAAPTATVTETVTTSPPSAPASPSTIVSSAVASSAAAAPPSSSASGAPGGAGILAACSTTALRITVDDSQAQGGAGNSYYPLNFTNTSGSACEMYGFPGVSFAAAPTTAGQQIGAAALRSDAFANTAVRLAPGHAAHAWLKVAVAANFPSSACQPVTVHWLRIYPPGETVAGYVSHTFSACSSASAVLLTVLPVRAGQGVAGVTP
jgi:Domain of unknown function (DUF4232)